MKDSKNVVLLGYGDVHVKIFGKSCSALHIQAEKNNKTAFPKETAHCGLSRDS